MKLIIGGVIQGLVSLFSVTNLVLIGNHLLYSSCYLLRNLSKFWLTSSEDKTVFQLTVLNLVENSVSFIWEKFLSYIFWSLLVLLRWNIYKNIRSWSDNGKWIIPKVTLLLKFDKKWSKNDDLPKLGLSGKRGGWQICGKKYIVCKPAKMLLVGG